MGSVFSYVFFESAHHWLDVIHGHGHLFSRERESDSAVQSLDKSCVVRHAKEFGRGL